MDGSNTTDKPIKLSWYQKFKLNGALNQAKRLVRRADKATDDHRITYEKKMRQTLKEMNAYLVFEDDNGKELVEADFATLTYSQLKEYTMKGMDALKKYL